MYLRKEIPCTPRLAMSDSALQISFTQTMCAVWCVLYVCSITGVICSPQGLSVGVIQSFRLMLHLVIYWYRANAKYFKGNSNNRNQPISSLLCTRIVFYSCCCVNVSKLACGPETRETQNIFSGIFIMFIFLSYLNGDVLFALRLQSSRCFSSYPRL